jgi:hypothetical protein
MLDFAKLSVWNFFMPRKNLREILGGGQFKQQKKAAAAMQRLFQTYETNNNPEIS